MKVIIDARWLFLVEHGTGVNRWTFNLMKALSSIMEEGELVQFYNFTRKKHFKRIEKYSIAGVSEKIVRIPTAIMDQFLINYRLPAELFLGKHDIFHGVKYFTPATLKARKVITIHDLYHIRFPDSLDKSWQAYLDSNLSRMVRIADRITTVSDATTRDVVEFLGVDESKVVTLGSSHDSELFYPRSGPEIELAVNKYFPDARPYIFYVGLLSPWKNLERLIEAFGILKDTKRSPHILVLAGKEYMSESIMQAINESNYKEDIILPGFIENEELPALYSGADFFVFPSLWEGFGIPLLESMACGTPVLSSSLASIPEIVGDGGILVDPYSVEEMAEGMLKITEGNEFRKTLGMKAIASASRFCWDDVARKTLSVYSELA